MSSWRYSNGRITGPSSEGGTLTFGNGVQKHNQKMIAIAKSYDPEAGYKLQNGSMVYTDPNSGGLKSINFANNGQGIANQLNNAYAKSLSSNQVPATNQPTQANVPSTNPVNNTNNSNNSNNVPAYNPSYSEKTQRMMAEAEADRQSNATFSNWLGAGNLAINVITGAQQLEMLKTQRKMMDHNLKVAQSQWKAHQANSRGFGSTWD